MIKKGKIKIENGIPIPPRKPGRKKYPWRDLEIGESFLVRKDHRSLQRLQIILLGCARQTRTERTFVTRQIEAENGVRVWRTK